MKENNGTQQKIKRFTVKFDGKAIRNKGDAIRKFIEWRKKWAYDEPFTIHNIRKESVFLIHYSLGVEPDND